MGADFALKGMNRGRRRGREAQEEGEGPYADDDEGGPDPDEPRSHDDGQGSQGGNTLCTARKTVAFP